MDNDLQKIRQDYNNIEQIWPENDVWHQYTKSQIENSIYKWISPKQQDLILNAGSGGTDYAINGIVHHLDIAEQKIKDKLYYKIGSVENIPYEDNMFDFIICVGSVLNYTQALTTIKELSRVIKPNGNIILEYERSNTGELIFSKNYGQTCTCEFYNYNGQEHKLWLYSDKYINNICSLYSLKIVKQKRFHIISSIVSKYKSEEIGAKYAKKFDKISKVLSYLLSHNRIMLLRKCITD